MEGLRGERQLWGRELAQQGAELAQDRGRMEAQIETLTSENASLREELQVIQTTSICQISLKSRLMCGLMLNSAVFCSSSFKF